MNVPYKPPPWLILPSVMDLLFKANDELHAHCRSHGENDAARYVRDFRTIQLNYGQRTGKTNYIMHTAATEDLIVTLGDHSFRYYSSNPDVRAEIVRLRVLTNVLGPSKAPRRYPRVWIDGNWCMSPSDSTLWDEQLVVYRQLVHDVDQQFIILG